MFHTVMSVLFFFVGGFAAFQLFAIRMILQAEYQRRCFSLTDRTGENYTLLDLGKGRRVILPLSQSTFFQLTWKEWKQEEWFREVLAENGIELAEGETPRWLKNGNLYELVRIVQDQVEPDKLTVLLNPRDEQDLIGGSKNLPKVKLFTAPPTR